MLAGYLDWPGVAQVCRVRAEVKAGGEESYEVSYAMTSAPRDRAGAATLLGWHRGHWGIENRLHWVRDVTMGEDANRTWSGRSNLPEGDRGAAAASPDEAATTAEANTEHER